VRQAPAGRHVAGLDGGIQAQQLTPGIVEKHAEDLAHQFLIIHSNILKLRQVKDRIAENPHILSVREERKPGNE
jgi:hypothetical protein